jgi:hypothetical protein
MSVGLAWKSAAKSNEKLVNQKYATWSKRIYNSHYRNGVPAMFTS